MQQTLQGKLKTEDGEEAGELSESRSSLEAGGMLEGARGRKDEETLCGVRGWADAIAVHQATAAQKKIGGQVLPDAG